MPISLNRPLKTKDFMEHDDALVCRDRSVDSEADYGLQKKQKSRVVVCELGLSKRPVLNRSEVD